MNLSFEQLTTEQKLGMVYCARPRTEADLDFAIQLIRKRALGSIQLWPHKKEQVKRVLAAADYPLLVLCDAESGFPGSAKQPIPLMSLSACNKPEYYEVFAKAIVTEARAAGFNGNWGPVIDVLSGNAPASVSRKFSDDPMQVARGAEIICQVYARNGYMSCGKHYPGHRNSLAVDTHMCPSPSFDTEEDLEKFSLVPYKYLMERGLLPSIMTDHTEYQNIDPDTPATLSAKINQIIRKTGWDGVSFTDSFAMMPILQKYGEERVIGLAVAAGNDIVLPNYRTSVEDSFRYLQQNYRDGLFTEERLNEAARRVVTLQNRLAEIPEPVDVFTEEDQRLYDRIAADCITAVTDDGVDAALDPAKSKLFIIVTGNTFVQEASNLEITAGEWHYPNRMAQKIKEVFPNAGIEFLPEFPTGADNERVLVASSKYDETICMTFCKTGAYWGTDDLTRRVESVINALTLSGRLGAVVHFGNPFALQPLLHIPRKIFGYNMPDSQLYAIDVLAGTLPANGTLPYHISFQ